MIKEIKILKLFLSYLYFIVKEMNKIKWLNVNLILNFKMIILEINNWIFN